MNVHRRTLLRGVIAGTAGVLVAPAVASATPSKKASPTRNIRYQAWRGAAGFAAGTFQGSSVPADGLVIDAPAGVFSYTDPFKGGSQDYEYATWTSPWVLPGFAA